MPTTKEEYNKYFQSEEHIRRIEMVKKGIENAKIRSERQRKLADLRARRYRRQEVTEEYEI